MPSPSVYFQKLDTAAHAALLPAFGLSGLSVTIEHNVDRTMVRNRNFDVQKITWTGGTLHVTGFLLPTTDVFSMLVPKTTLACGSVTLYDVHLSKFALKPQSLAPKRAVMMINLSFTFSAYS